MSIGQRLREERERLGMSQERFAAIGGVQKRAQINYEAGERVPDALYLEGISLVGVNVQYVVTGKSSQATTPSITVDEQMLLDSYREAPPAVRKAALAALLSGGSANGGQSVVGNNAIQIGNVAGKARIKNK